MLISFILRLFIEIGINRMLKNLLLKQDFLIF